MRERYFSRFRRTIPLADRLQPWPTRLPVPSFLFNNFLFVLGILAVVLLVGDAVDNHGPPRLALVTCTL